MFFAAVAGGHLLPCTVAVAVPIAIAIVTAAAFLQFRSIAKLNQLYTQLWTATRNRSAPWPFFAQDAKHPHARSAVLLVCSIPLLLVHVIVIKLFLAIVLVLLPFRAAEWIRLKLTPERPHLFDTIAYLLSILGMALKLTALR